MKISNLHLPESLVESYKKKGIEDLYPPQEECVRMGLLENKNLLISIPTASGKTLVAEMAMHKHIENGGKCLYVVPLKALAAEKFSEFSDKGVRVGIATGDLDKKDDFLGKNDIIITTSEKADSLLRNRAVWMNMITCLVLDEAHLIDSEDRGATLEMVITKLRYLNDNMQVIALTATIGNPKKFAEWLSADLVTSKWRPVDLKEGVFFSDTIYSDTEEKKIKTPTKHDDANLCLDCIEEGGQCLVFVNSRRNAEGFAKRMAKVLEKSDFSDPELEIIQKKLEDAAETEMGRILAICTGKGASFHHAGMKKDQRQIVEQGFRDGHIKVISSTPTLAAGLNLPARRVIIRDYMRFKGGFGMVPIPVREYRQMAGRAGRPHLDPYGEAVLIAKGRESANGLYEEFIDAPAEDVKSRLDDESIITAHILSLISTGFVKESADLVSFLERTFYVYLNKKSKYLSKIVDNAVEFLESAEMITRLGDQLSATEYGNLVSRLYINPVTAEIITEKLKEKQNAINEGEKILLDSSKTGFKEEEKENKETVFSDIGLLQLLCTTPDMYTMYVKKDDLPVLEKFFYEHEDELWVGLSYDTMEEDFAVLKTAMLLDNWINEIGDETICTRFNVGPGDIYNVVESMKWLLYSASRISYMMAPDLRVRVREVELRMKHGIKRELLPLVKLRNIGRVRARRLFNNGFSSPEKIKNADFSKLSAILGKKIAEDVLEQVKREEHDYPGSDYSKKENGSGFSEDKNIRSKVKSKEENIPKGRKKIKATELKDSEAEKKKGGQSSLFEF
ncbi:ATP-dependent DNA helicase [Methanoplanus sp. FWC-SCC4]|uniref:ATP-dependent DNA helicase Hel308 n=1 Tax=Methanochimaera problematica TaxID=2609417 RepID=A0AA97FCW7_9EURY|nr:ATP-dependent DNA helicase [Methanoplanus sp. FWC-SCC4]WOF17185.1 ATP-dependent DNA helicase [Methanoplanus sp. FWC-SCC4]